ncbi:6,7-dimethyl-8-ribityllumazine synthase [Enhygromyxa salina]|uniref:6,7-dimethyl-8-ribityllumazine synthase n=1 Tax=Enhygromyxa salina TaxID=215803 RepID=A0A2S9YVX3_9BACT|nr:6,7-dimethyl-8-ribityllumazine synthase [Enhygromyxa salina]PRQ09261.1 6,7-dimethyl-8-ribityllumazine synthase [Enhygromyxa salina]
MQGGSSKVQIVEGSLDATGLRFGVLVARFNAIVTEPLLDGAVDALVRSGAKPSDVVVFRTPGSYELPMLADKVLASGRFDAVIALGCLIRGDTIHFDLIAAQAAKGLASAGQRHRKPVAFGVLTTETLEQAINRAGAKAGNKGAEAAMAAIEQARLYLAIEKL